MDDHAIILKISQNMNKILDKDPPVIGILTKSVEEEERPFIGYRELIEPKYLFILQNAAVIPISLYSSEAEMEEIMGKINGLCLPGGYSNIWKLSRTNKVESDYTKAGRKLLGNICPTNSMNYNACQKHKIYIAKLLVLTTHYVKTIIVVQNIIRKV
eukprot:TRINITY_DN3636_c0_g1_i1.p3 TRINITY_DN3636_c0_g1~~TRINITY_DN3636_c0_g1_i1.p3  ORF type:complete len:157 (+),score=14.76 TRINITY_DN3636_c0_g1_i1:103-573(+)